MMEPFKKYIVWIMSFFVPLTCVTLFQFYSITSLVLLCKNSELWNERKEDIFIYGCFSVIALAYVKGGRKS